MGGKCGELDSEGGGGGGRGSEMCGREKGPKVCIIFYLGQIDPRVCS